MNSGRGPAFGIEARAELERRLALAKGADPFAPVTVVVPSNYAGLHLRQAVARTGTGAHAGLVNVRFSTLARLAQLLAAPQLAREGRAPLTSTLDRAAVSQILASVPNRYRAQREHPQTVAGVGAALRELRAEATRSAPTDDLGDLVRLSAAYGSAIAPYYDDVDLCECAARVVANGTGATQQLFADIGALILFLPTNLTPSMRGFVAALRDHAALDAVLAWTGDVAADDETETLAAAFNVDRVAVPSVPMTPLTTPSIVVLDTPDPDEEVRSVVRRIRGLIEDEHHPVAPESIAIVYVGAAPYARIIQETLDAAPLAYSAPAVRRLADTVAGRVIRGLLALPAVDFRRDAIIDLVAGTPLRDPTAGADESRFTPGVQWDRISRRSGVIDGVAQWHERLDAHATSIAARTRDGEPPRDLALTRGLDRFVKDLAQRVQPPAESTWAGYAQWAIALVDAYVSPGTSWPTIEIEANDVVHDRLAALEAFDRFDVPVDGLSFAAAVEAELDAPIGHQGRVGTGVFVGPPSAMRGLSFDTVFIVGAADGRVPSVVQPDPILPDAVRTQWGLPAIAARAARERREYLVATAAATKALVVSYPRADPRATQSLEPSPWVAELPREVLPSYAGALARAPHAVGFDELVTQELLRAGLAGRAVNDHPAFAAARLAHGYATIAGRRSAVMTEFDGLVERDAQRLRGERFYSSTGLQDFVDCPFRYFLKSVLHVQSVDRPESADTIEPRERGNLLHQVLERFFGERVGAMPVPTQAWSAADHAALQRIATACITEFEQEGRVGQPGLWKFEQRRVRRELAAVLETDSRLRAELGLTPTYFEASFGSFAADEDAGPTLPPVEIQIDADTTMRFRGRIDRIDRTEEDGLMVLDYKTGKQSAAPLDESRVDGGRRLQLAIYGLAARGFHPTGPVRAAYWYTRESIATNLETIDVDAVTEEKLHEALSCTASAIRAGTFPMIPGDEDRNSYQHCRYCDYQRLCPGDRAHQWERKQDDPALEPVITLVTLGEKPAAAAKAATP